MTKQQIKRRIERAIAKLANIRTAATTGLVPPSLKDGKLYEAHVLTCILEKAVNDEGLKVVFRPGNNVRARLTLRSSGGPITDNYPHFDLVRNGRVIGEVWTDIEFLSLSFCRSAIPRPITAGDCHELDILVVEPGIRGMPK